MPSGCRCDDRGRAISVKSPVVGWLTDTATLGYKGTAERGLIESLAKPEFHLLCKGTERQIDSGWTGQVLSVSEG